MLFNKKKREIEKNKKLIKKIKTKHTETFYNLPKPTSIGVKFITARD